MKIESPSFTEADYHAIMGAYLERERKHLIDRLRQVIEETEALVPSLDGAGPSDGDSWNALETLAHMAVAAQFFGWVIHEVTKGSEIGDQMIELMNLRDPAIVDAVRNPPAVLAQQLRDSLDRTIEFLEDVPYEDLRTQIGFAGRALSAEDFTRISLVHHLEDHVEQMQESIGSRAP
jgi:hypothetical protein